MTSATEHSPGPVTADDVDQAVRLSVAALGEVPDSGWDTAAAGLQWTCWQTAEHLADDLFAYALQLGPRVPSLTTHVPATWRRTSQDGPACTILVDPAEGGPGLLQVLEACGALLTSMVRTTSPSLRSHHVYGASDPAGFGAMGVVETLVHTHDITAGVGLPFEPPADLCARPLYRLFPDAPSDVEPWPALLWSTGRVALPGRERRTGWRWYGEPRG